MAQILKHRRGDIGLLNNVGSRKGELLIATGSVGSMAGPWLFIGDSDTGAGHYRAVSKIYMGANVPSLSSGVYGTTLDGTPFYETSNKSLYVLNSIANEKIDITGNIENRTISGVTINNLTGSNATFSSYVSASAINVSGNTQVEGKLVVTNDISGSKLYLTSNVNVVGNIVTSGSFIASGNIVTSGSLIASGDIISSGSLIASGNITSQGDLTTNGNLEVLKSVDIKQNLMVSGSSTLLGDLLVSGNVSFLGSASYVHISSSVIELDDNIIKLNAYSPFERYAGFEVTDSGSINNASASLLWDSANDYWMIVSSDGQSSKIVGITSNLYGSELSLTNGAFPFATSNHTIGDSLLTLTGTTLALNVNKFTVDTNSGETLVAGNLTLSSSGGTDAGSKSSIVTFKNSSNIIGYVSSTETLDVMDGILGYRHSDGKLVFSTVIDGGEYTIV